MTLRTRVLTVTLDLPDRTVTLEQDINLKVKIYKAALAIQNRCTIDIIGLTGSLREQLLSQFTAWNQRQVESGQAEQKWVNVEVKAGWATPSRRDVGTNNEQPSTVFKGQVAICELTSTPPNIGVRLTCFTRQIDKTKFVTEPAPDGATFKAYVTWAAAQMGFGTNFICDTSNDDKVISNPARSIFVASALLIAIQNMYMPDVAAFVDDDILIVKDRSKILNPSESVELSEFIGIPTWTEWGVSFTVLFDQGVRLAQGATLNSIMNPSLNGTYVVMELEYDLTSRDNAFYVKASGSPPA